MLNYFPLFSDQNYFFSQQQGRFTPSFQNTRNGFFATDNNQPQNAPGSYQEQRLYLGGDEQQQDTTDGYFPFTSFVSFVLISKNYFGVLFKEKSCHQSGFNFYKISEL